MTSRAGPSSEAAFTLLEVLVVMMILAIIGTGVTFGIAGARDRVQLGTAESRIDNFLMYLRRRARQEARSILVEFDPAMRRYRTSGEAWRDLPSGVVLSLSSDRRTAKSNPSITFFSDGSASVAELGISVGPFSTMRRIDRLTGSIHDARR